MDLDNIENLNEEQVLDLYQNVVNIESDLISGEICSYSACPCGCRYLSDGTVDKAKCAADARRGYCK